jgi:hypothetical protein
MPIHTSWLTGALIVTAIFLGGNRGMCQTAAPSAKPAATAPADPNAPRQMVFDPAQWRKKYAEQMMTALSANENEWIAIEPLIQRIQSLQMALTAASQSGAGGMGGWMGTEVDHADAVKEMLKALNKTGQALAAVTRDKNAGLDAIKFSLKDYRAARAAVQGELDKQEAELKRQLTPRQEAVLKQMGIVE